jgi:uncharacterized protein YeeX (DUF496 family)
MAKQRKAAKVKIEWLNHLLGFLGVILGVLIAFWLNNWAQDRKEMKIARVALANIRNEVARNLESLDSVILLNQRQMSFFDAYLEYTTDDMGFRGEQRYIDSLKQLYPEYIQDKNNVTVSLRLYELPDVAWRTTLNSSVLSAIDFELVYHLNETYSLQQKLSQMDKQLIDGVISIKMDQKKAMTNLQETLDASLQLAVKLKDRNYPEVLTEIDIFTGVLKKEAVEAASDTIR